MHPSKYEKLKAGDEYTFKSAYLEHDGKGYKVKFRTRRGKLEHVTTRWKENRDKNGKLVSKELVGDTVKFIPVEETVQWGEEELKVHAVYITAGFFEVEK